MLCAKSNRLLGLAALTSFSALFIFAADGAALAQQPPLTIPAGGPPPADPNAVMLGDWFLYPSLDVFAEDSNDYFLSPQSKISGWALGASTSATAEWSNGIHTTTLFGNFEHLQYLTDSAATTDDGEATITQRYAPLRDLAFTFLGDYTHRTIASGLTNAIPAPVVTTASTVLPNGNTVLPNGVIISPSGQVVGQSISAPTTSALSVVNPSNQFTGTARVEKLFDGGIWTLGASLLRTDYEQQQSGQQDFTAATFTEDGSFWLGPLCYFFSDGSFTFHDADAANSNSTAYRIVGGLGTRQFGLFGGTLYFGHQGSDSGSGPAGGNIYGGTLTYYPTADLTIRGIIDDTVNYAPQASSLNLALSLPVPSPLQVSLSSSTNVTSIALRPEYRIAPAWTLTGLFGYIRVEYLGSPALSTAWLADATLRYDIWRNLSLSWEYQYSGIVADLPLSSAVRNLIVMRASYRF